MNNILIIDCGMGNLHSIWKRFTLAKATPIVSSDPNDISKADKIILPGIGHFQMAVENLKKLNLYEPINEAVLLKQKPILGICLGMQLMAKTSEEGNADGFGWLDAEVVKFRVEDKLKYKIPHIGWNQVVKKKDSVLMKNIPDLSEFYFAHAYHLQSNEPRDIINETEYEYRFPSAIEKGNIFGVQYHPEKSHDLGELLLKNFITL